MKHEMLLRSDVSAKTLEWRASGEIENDDKKIEKEVVG